MEWIVQKNGTYDRIKTSGTIPPFAEGPVRINDKPYLVNWDPHMHRLRVKDLSVETGKELVLETSYSLRGLTRDRDRETGHMTASGVLTHGQQAMSFEKTLQPASHVGRRRKDGTKEAPKKQRSPMTGKLIKWEIELGQVVRKGDLIAVIEAMKMENKIASQLTGTVTKLMPDVGAMVRQGDDLFETKHDA